MLGFKGYYEYKWKVALLENVPETHESCTIQYNI